MTLEDQWLSMAVGALRAAGLAAAALGYHVWKLLTKQGSDVDIEDYDEVLVQASLPLSGFHCQACSCPSLKMQQHCL